MGKSGKILVEMPDVPEVGMWIYESVFPMVDSYKKPESIFFPDLDENMHDAVECWLAGMVITDNPVVASNGNQYEVDLARVRRDEAFEVIEKIQSLRGKKEEEA